MKKKREATDAKAVCCGWCYVKSGKTPEKGPKRVLFREKCHTLKIRVIIERSSLQIIDVQEAKGGGNSMAVDTDSGYHANIYILVKSSKKYKLTKKEKVYNKRLSRRRVVIEHIKAKIKTFKSMAYPCWGHRCSRHSLRIILVCCIINYDRMV
jgi:hypothetical protein